jgi:hypothetical protein
VHCSSRHGQSNTEEKKKSIARKGRKKTKGNQTKTKQKRRKTQTTNKSKKKKVTKNGDGQSTGTAPSNGSCRVRRATSRRLLRRFRLVPQSLSLSLCFIFAFVSFHLLCVFFDLLCFFFGLIYFVFGFFFDLI